MNIKTEDLGKIREILNLVPNNTDDILELMVEKLAFGYGGNGEPNLIGFESIIKQMVEQKAYYDDVAISLFARLANPVFTCESIDGKPVVIGRTADGRKIITQYGSFTR